MQTSGTVICGRCGQGLAWRWELAGKQGRCRCGAPVQLPVSDPGAYVQPVVEFDVAPERGMTGRSGPGLARVSAGLVQCKGCKVLISAGSMTCMQCGVDPRTGRKPGPVHASFGQQNPQAGMDKKWLIGASVFGVLVVMAAFVVMLPQAAAASAFWIGLMGLVVMSVGSIWARYVAADGDTTLRLASRYLPFIGLLVIASRCATDWHRIKVPVLIMLAGAALSICGLGAHYFLFMHGMHGVGVGGE